jgi:hypothetical protein
MKSIFVNDIPDTSLYFSSFKSGMSIACSIQSIDNSGFASFMIVVWDNRRTTSFIFMCDAVIPHTSPA